MRRSIIPIGDATALSRAEITAGVIDDDPDGMLGGGLVIEMMPIS